MPVRARGRECLVDSLRVFEWHGQHDCVCVCFHSSPLSLWQQQEKIEREVLTSSNDEFFSQLAEMLIHLESQPVWGANPRIQYSSCQVFGVLAPFFKRNSAFLQPVFSFLYNHLVRDTTAKAAAFALKEICKRCPELLGKWILVLWCPG